MNAKVSPGTRIRWVRHRLRRRQKHLSPLTRRRIAIAALLLLLLAYGAMLFREQPAYRIGRIEFPTLNLK